MTSDDLVKLREVAKAAEPFHGGWDFGPNGAIVNPTTILSLLDRLEALQRLCGRAAEITQKLYDPRDEGCNDPPHADECETSEHLPEFECWICALAALQAELREASKETKCAA